MTTRRDPSLADYFRLIQKRRMLVYTVIICSVLVSVFLSRILPRRYKVELLLYPLGAPDIFSLTGSQSTVRRPVFPLMNQDIAMTHLAMMKTKRMDEIVAELIPERSLKDIIGSIDIDLDSDSYMFKVTVIDGDPEIAARIANTFGDNVNRIYEDLSLVPTKNTRRFIEEEIVERKKTLDKARIDVEEFQKRNKLLDLNKEVDRVVNVMANFRSRRDENVIKLRENEETTAAVEEQMGEEAGLYSYDEMVAVDPVIQELNNRLTELQINLAVMLTDMTELHPEVIKQKTEIDKVKESIEEEVARLSASYTKTPGSFYESMRQQLVSLTVSSASLREVNVAIDSLLVTFEENIATYPSLLAEYADLTTELRRHESVYHALTQRLEEIIIQEMREQKLFVVVDHAEPPTTSFFPSLINNAVIAIILGLSGSIIYVFLLSYIERIKEARLEETHIYSFLSEGEE